MTKPIPEPLIDMMIDALKQVNGMAHYQHGGGDVFEVPPEVIDRVGDVLAVLDEQTRD